MLNKKGQFKYLLIIAAIVIIALIIWLIKGI